MARILVVDDEKNILVLFKKILTRRPSPRTDGNETGSVPPDVPIEVSTALNGEIAWSMIQAEDFDLIISDLAMGTMNGIELLQLTKSVKPKIPFIILTGVGTVEDAVKAIKMGAYDYITKPFQHDEIILTIDKALEYHRLNLEVQRLRDRLSDQGGPGIHQLTGKSKAMTKIFELIRVVSKSDSTVLIEGESGTGKEWVARAIHQESLRNDYPFMAVNCDSIPDALLESELFGHVRGAFDGASHDKQGLIREAEPGTVFLDEIGEMSLSTQTKLLRALQEREIRPAGSHKSVPFDVRFITSTHHSIHQLILNKLFREDLYYRLSVITIKLPPLRDRKEDIPLIVNFFLEKYSRLNQKPPVKISDQAMEQILNYPWPGNIRELENMIERAVVISSDTVLNLELPVIDPEFLQSHASPIDPSSAFQANLSFHLNQDQTDLIHELLKRDYPLKQINEIVSRQAEKTAIIKVLSDVLGNRAEASRRLGISRPALYSKMKEYGIE